jgi:hypothetical protein
VTGAEKPEVGFEAGPVSVLTFDRLKKASFTHSVIYTTLLIVWLVPGLHTFEFVFGLAHGLGWIAMSIACLYAARTRIVSLRTAVAVVVIGGIGPFVGSYEFVQEGKRRGQDADSVSTAGEKPARGSAAERPAR